MFNFFFLDVLRNVQLLLSTLLSSLRKNSSIFNLNNLDPRLSPTTSKPWSDFPITDTSSSLPERSVLSALRKVLVVISVITPMRSAFWAAWQCSVSSLKFDFGFRRNWNQLAGKLDDLLLFAWQQVCCYVVIRAILISETPSLLSNSKWSSEILYFKSYKKTLLGCPLYLVTGL